MTTTLPRLPLRGGLEEVRDHFPSTGAAGSTAQVVDDPDGGPLTASGQTSSSASRRAWPGCSVTSRVPAPRVGRSGSSARRSPESGDVAPAGCRGAPGGGVPSKTRSVTVSTATACP
ncbi:MAG: hypothetical protein M3237_20005 [Actinomycetota bacterium]|nr:hypothetical protein [Actinomycetota bacterium]